jgi:hypothetical protein
VNPLEKSVRAWLARNRAAIGSADGYPGEFHRKELFARVRPGSLVAWLLPARPGDKERTLQTGRVQILTRDSHAVCLVTGSSGARPGLVDTANIVWCSGAPRAMQLPRKEASP